MRTLNTMIAIVCVAAVFVGCRTQVEKPSVAKLHAWKAYYHAMYMKQTAADAGGCNKLLHTTELPSEGTDRVVSPALDHLLQIKTS